MATVTQPAPAAASAVSPIAAAINEQKRVVAAGAFHTLGQIDLIHTVSKGSIDFRKAGPMLGAMPERNDLLITTEVPPLPPLRRLLNEPCPKCARPCVQCEGSKSVACHACGGAGTASMGVNCECMAAGARPKLDCPNCSGTGRRAETAPCRRCSGTGTQSCPNCFGTGQEGRGCPDCENQGRKIELVPQKLSAYVHGTLEGRVAVGPLRAIVFHPLGGRGSFEIVDFRPDREQNLAVLCLEFAAGDASGAARGFLIGGYPVIRNRQGRA